MSLQDAVDWSLNDKIAIASTDFNHNHSEVRRIVSISTDNKTLTLDSPLTYLHYSEIETYGTSTIPMQAEVGLLTRNIHFQGSTNEVTDDDKYGAHNVSYAGGNRQNLVY